jgi:hypothetical protein
MKMKLSSFFTKFYKYWSTSGMKLTGRNRQLGENPVPVPLCPPQIPHGLTRDRTRASAVRGRRLTAWAMAWPLIVLTQFIAFINVCTLRHVTQRTNENKMAAPGTVRVRIMVHKVALGQDFLRVLRFPLTVSLSTRSIIFHSPTCSGYYIILASEKVLK